MGHGHTALRIVSLMVGVAIMLLCMLLAHRSRIAQANRVPSPFEKLIGRIESLGVVVSLPGLMMTMAHHDHKSHGWGFVFAGLAIQFLAGFLWLLNKIGEKWLTHADQEPL